jgi:uncharacterized membrane protein
MADANNTPATGFDFNRPTIVALLYLASFFVGITGLIGLILSYVWQSETRGTWEESHLRFHIRTFWIALLGCVIAAILTLVLIGLIGFLAIGLWVLIRTIIAMVAAQKRQPIADPATWLW